MEANRRHCAEGAVPDLEQDCRRPVAVLDIGGMDDDTDQESAGIGQDVTFAPFDFLARVAPASASAFCLFYGLTVNDAGRRAGVTTSHPTHLHHQKMIDCQPKPTVAPSIKPTLNRRNRRKILRQHSPCDPTPKHIENGIQDRTEPMTAWSANTRRAGEKRSQKRPFPVCQIT
jgi:hypothetical protein